MSAELNAMGKALTNPARQSRIVGIQEEDAMTQWQPVWQQSSEQWAQAWAAIEEIASALEDITNGVENNTSIPGYADHEAALFFAFLGQATGNDARIGQALTLLNRSIDRAPRLRSMSLFGGLPAVALAATQITPLVGAVSEDDGADAVESVDRALLRAVRRRAFGRYFDLIDGLAGHGVYFLERLPRPAALEGLQCVIAELARASEASDGGLTWRTSPDILPDWQRETNPNGYYNLGVAHGVPGVIHLLSEAAEVDAVRAEAAPLLDGAMRWLLAQECAPSSVSLYPWLAGDRSSPSRLGWCYGDLGIAVVLQQVAWRSGRSDWQDAAQRVIGHCLARDASSSLVVDAGLCHGAAGVAHMYNRLFHAGGGSRCQTAARYWFEKTLALRRPGEGIGGYFAVKMATKTAPAEYHPSPTLLEGAIGVGLALLAAVSGTPPSWDRSLLLSGSSMTATQNGNEPAHHQLLFA